jgi:hypothetical protein
MNSTCSANLTEVMSDKMCLRRQDEVSLIGCFDTDARNTFVATTVNDGAGVRLPHGRHALYQPLMSAASPRHPACPVVHSQKTAHHKKFTPLVDFKSFPSFRKSYTINILAV